MDSKHQMALVISFLKFRSSLLNEEAQQSIHKNVPSYLLHGQNGLCGPVLYLQSKHFKYQPFILFYIFIFILAFNQEQAIFGQLIVTSI